MATGNVANYQGNSAIEVVRGDGVVKVKVYNNSTVLTAYRPYVLVPGWITGVGAVMVPIAPATNTVMTSLIGVPQEAIAASTYGYCVIEGYCKVNVTETIVANDQLEVKNGGTTFVDQGANGLTLPGADVAAITCDQVESGVWNVWLLGYPHLVNA